MNEINIIKKKVSNDLIKKTPSGILGDLITKNTKVICDDGSLLLYKIMPKDFIENIRKVVATTNPNKTFRSGGLLHRSSIFGVNPRIPYRHDWCRFSTHSQKEKENFKIMCKSSIEAGNIYKETFPENFETAMNEVHSNICPDWIYLKDTPYLTMNVNMNNAIKFHRDRGNFPLALSTILILKKDIAGGELVLPELNITLAMQDGAFVLFSGQSLIHGVMPIKKTSEEGFRASIVFYTLQGMKNCLNRPEEAARCRINESNRNIGKYSLEKKMKIISMNRRALAKKNSYLIKELEEYEANSSPEKK